MYISLPSERININLKEIQPELLPVQVTSFYLERW